jgi:hypothetical protein
MAWDQHEQEWVILVMWSQWLFAVYFSYGNILTSLCGTPSSRPLLNLNFSLLRDSYGHPYLPASLPCKETGHSLCRYYRPSKLFLMLDFRFSQRHLLSELCKTAILCGLLDPEYEGPAILWNMRHNSYSTDKTASHSRRALFSSSSSPNYNQFHSWLSVFHAADSLTYTNDLSAAHKP